MFQREIMGNAKYPAAKIVPILAALEVLEQRKENFLYNFFAVVRRQA
jgi:hypothetical protein